MLKKTFKWLIISSCALLLCGVFIIYVIECIDAIMSEQTERTEREERAERTEFESESDQVVSASESQDMPAATQCNDSAVIRPPSAVEPSENSQWRVIERSESLSDQLQYYSPYNVNLDSGRVVITTHKKSVGDKRYTSGMVESENAYLYGKFSFVISVSEGKGLFPAIWLMPAKNKSLPEIDIFEMIGNVPDEFYGVVHYMSGSTQSRDFFKTKVEKKDTYLIKFEWTRRWLRWFIDGKCMFETSKFVPDEPMYLIVNQAVGGQWPGPPDENTAFPATFILKSWTIEPEWSQPR